MREDREGVDGEDVRRTREAAPSTGVAGLRIAQCARFWGRAAVRERLHSAPGVLGLADRNNLGHR
jgi:hypothetical protein